MMSAIDSYPWLQAPWRKLAQQMDRLPHALLLAGQAGLGKNQLALELARRLLCAETNGMEACRHCKSCMLFDAHTHPDLRIVSPPEEGKAISIDQIRELLQYLNLKPHTASNKLVILTPAEEMTAAAANALLKQLEEPPLGSVLLLVSHQAHRLPPTIRSRCSRIDIAPPDRATALAWLGDHDVDPHEAVPALVTAGGAPVMSMHLIEQGFLEDRKTFLSDLLSIADSRGNPIACAERWQQRGSAIALNWFFGFLLDLIKTGMGAGDAQHWNNPDALEALQSMSEKIPAHAVAELMATITQGLSLLTTPLDERLLLEDILIRWNKATTH